MRRRGINDEVENPKQDHPGEETGDSGGRRCPVWGPLIPIVGLVLIVAGAILTFVNASRYLEDANAAKDWTEASCFIKTVAKFTFKEFDVDTDSGERREEKTYGVQFFVNVFDSGYSGSGDTILNYTVWASLFPSFSPCGSQDGFSETEKLNRNKWIKQFRQNSWQTCWVEYPGIGCASLVVGGDHWIGPLVGGIILLFFGILSFIARAIFCCCSWPFVHVMDTESRVDHNNNSGLSISNPETELLTLTVGTVIAADSHL